ncbi:MAG: hydroxyacylglutathione hydrolase [Euryarchaeota archaeon]|nr:hydroxyacylglutathione hydrolase [Euryarchaeota archaeon]
MSKAKSVCDRVYAVGGSGLSAPEDAFVYLVDAGSELVMIDAGVGYGINRIEDNIRSLGLEPAAVWHIIATHCHIDHIGGLSAWKERYGSKVIAHELDRAGIEGENNSLTAASMYGVDYRPVKVDMLLRGETERLRLGDMEFSFLHTPGHTPGSISVCIDTPDGRVLFGQDIHGPFSDSWGSDLGEWRKSMRKLLDLKADILCEGHAGIYRGEKVGKYIEGYLKRYES